MEFRQSFTKTAAFLFPTVSFSCRISASFFFVKLALFTSFTSPCQLTIPRLFFFYFEILYSIFSILKFQCFECFEVMSHNGVRMNAASQFLKNMHQNLDILTGAEVKRVSMNIINDIN